MDGVTQVQARISEIQTRFLYKTSSTGDWASAAAAAGLDGTSATSTGSSTASASESAVVAQAQKYIGVPYLWGGTDPSKGLDCSGFTQYVYNKAGISIPRTASAQQRAATRVTSPRPGDLVFYGSPAYHVGIFTGGDMMIDSPRTGKSTSERNMWGTPTGFGRF